jgi:hypothetical protein
MGFLLIKMPVPLITLPKIADVKKPYNLNQTPNSLNASESKSIEFLGETLN